MALYSAKDDVLEVAADAIGMPSHLLEKMSVDLECDGDVGMAQALSDLLSLDASQDENACVIVTAIMA